MILPSHFIPEYQKKSQKIKSGDKLSLKSPFERRSRVKDLAYFLSVLKTLLTFFSKNNHCRR